MHVRNASSSALRTLLKVIHMKNKWKECLLESSHREPCTKTREKYYKYIYLLITKYNSTHLSTQIETFTLPQATAPYNVQKAEQRSMMIHAMPLPGIGAWH